MIILSIVPNPYFNNIPSLPATSWDPPCWRPVAPLPPWTAAQRPGTGSGCLAEGRNGSEPWGIPAIIERVHIVKVLFYAGLNTEGDIKDVWNTDMKAIWHWDQVVSTRVVTEVITSLPTTARPMHIVFKYFCIESWN